MYSLETLKYLNSHGLVNFDGPRTERARSVSTLYQVVHNGGGLIHILSGGPPAVILGDVERQNGGPILAEVDATNPLDDAPLVAFHRTWEGPQWVANVVEGLASQHRRIVTGKPAQVAA